MQQVQRPKLNSRNKEETEIKIPLMNDWTPN